MKQKLFLIWCLFFIGTGIGVAQTCTITLSCGYYGTTSGSAVATCNSSTLTSLTHATRTGSELLGYYTSLKGNGAKVINADGTFVPYSNASGHTYTQDGKWVYNESETLTLYANFNIYFVAYSFPSLAGTGYSINNVANPVNYNYAPGQTLPLADGDVPGFEFQGWYLEDTYETRVTAIDCSWAPTNSDRRVTLYGKLSEPIVYTISYSIPAGVAAPNPANPTTYTIADVPFTLNPPGAREHYTFGNWVIDEHNLLLNNQITRNNLGNYTLTAGWSPVNYTFTVHCQKGMAVYNVLYDQVIHGGPITDEEDWVYTLPYQATVQLTLDYNNCNHDYTFDGLEIVVDGNTVTNFAGIFESDENASDNRAGWLTIVGNTTITFKSTNSVYNILYSYLPGKIRDCEPDPDFPDDRKKDHCVRITDYWHNPDLLTQTFICDSDEPVNTIKTLAGTAEASCGDGLVTFDGWYTDAELTTPISTPAIPAHTHWTSLPHFYAKWNAPIQYRDQGGVAYSGSTVGLPVNDYWCGPDVALPDPAARTGYTFGGWFDNSGCTGDPITVVPDDYAFYASDTNLPVVYAQWTPESYAITYKDKDNAAYSGTNEGSLVASHTYGTATDLVPGEREGYDFIGWYDNAGCTGDAVTAIGAEAKTAAFTLYAKWESNTRPHIDLYDNAAPQVNGVATTNAELLTTYSGTPVDVTLHHTFTAGLWNTLCLPFSLDLEYCDELDRNVYAMDNCTTHPVNGMTVTFSPVSEMTAGVPYLVWGENQMTAIDFTDVSLSRFTPDSTVAPSGDVVFRGVIETVYIKSKTSIYIGSGNRLYYANPSANGGQGTRVRGYRGYFEIKQTNGMEYVRPRVRIVVDNAETIELSAEGELETETRKYMENGVLIIERGGVRYDAQGKRIKEK